MNAHQRQQRCLNAIECALKQLRKKDYSDDLMEGLQSRFLSGSCLLESSTYMLTTADLTESEAQLLDLIPDLARLMMREEFGNFPRLNCLAAAGDYLKTLYIGIPIEQFYALCLDESGKLIRCELLQKGSVDETPFYLDTLLQSVIVSGASSVVLSHNHPGGTPHPSNADISCTITAISALYSIGIQMLDHIIIADNQVISLRRGGYISSGVWIDQDPSCTLLRNWLNEPC
jgi:DNA repair protein RadC